MSTEAGVANPNPRKRKKQALKIGHGGTLDSAASGVLGEGNAFSGPTDQQQSLNAECLIYTKLGMTITYFL